MGHRTGIFEREQMRKAQRDWGLEIKKENQNQSSIRKTTVSNHQLAYLSTGECIHYQIFTTISIIHKFYASNFCSPAFEEAARMNCLTRKANPVRSPYRFLTLSRGNAIQPKGIKSPSTVLKITPRCVFWIGKLCKQDSKEKKEMIVLLKNKPRAQTIQNRGLQ